MPQSACWRWPSTADFGQSHLPLHTTVCFVLKGTFIMALSIPPYASLMLQPLDEALLVPLETAYVRQADTFMADSPWKSLSYKLLVCFGQCSVSRTATSTVSAQLEFTHSAHTFFSEGCSCRFFTLQHFLWHTILILLALVFILTGVQRCQFVNVFPFCTYIE